MGHSPSGDDGRLLAALCLVLKIGGLAHIDNLHLYGLRLLLGGAVILHTHFLGYSVDGILHLGRRRIDRIRK